MEVLKWAFALAVILGGVAGLWRWNRQPDTRTEGEKRWFAEW